MNTDMNFDQPELAPIKDIIFLLSDPDVSEIMIDGYARIYIEKRGKFEDVTSPFQDNAQVMALVKAILHMAGRTVNESSTMLDARLPDGTSVNVVLPPVSLSGPALTLRKFETTPLTFDDLLRFGSLTEEMYQFLQACVASRMNIVIAGGVGSGKSTILNVMSSLIDDNERIISIDPYANLQPQKKRLVTLESRLADSEGKGEVTVRDLLRNAAKMRPDRIILGEVQGNEIHDLLHLMNTGYDGTMTSIHATSIRDTLTRMETMATFADASIPLLAVRETIASAIDIIVQQLRLRDGSRKIVAITEVAGKTGDSIALNDIFTFRQTGYENGKVIGRATATGEIPRVLERMQAAQVDLPLSLFTPN